MERKRYIDVAKGIGIFLVVWGHHPNHFFFKYIYTFHVPLFFLLSGLTFSLKDSVSIKAYAYKRAQRLLKPYFMYAAFLFLCWLLLEKWMGLGETGKLPVLKQFIGIFYAQGGDWFMGWGIPLWFLPTLFLTNVIYAVIIRRITRNILRIAIIILLLVVGMISTAVTPRPLPWSFDVALISLAYFALGHVLRQYPLEQYRHISIFAVALVLLAINIVTGLMNVRTVLYRYEYGNYFLFLCSSFSGVMAWYLISFFMDKFKMMEYLGRNSVVILAFHLRVLTFIVLCLNVVGLKLASDTVFGSLCLSVLQIASVLLLYGIYAKCKDVVLKKFKIESYLADRKTM